MNKTMKRSLAATLAGAALAVGAAAVAAIPAQAASVVSPGNNGKISYTPGVSKQVDLRWVYNGAAGNFTAATFTVDLPAGVSWDAGYTALGGHAKGGFVRVNEGYTAIPAYMHCDITTPTKLTCGGTIENNDGTPTPREASRFSLARPSSSAER
ncbi:hypothetical protein ACRAWB_16555 [Leifsonia poae]|uniref:hypothetical protein n=1 Tax=Leifsonia poae TaxID=110933 RepID=UPI003D68CF02